MKCQSLFSGGNKNNISKCRLPKFLPNTLSANKLISAMRDQCTLVSGADGMHIVSETNCMKCQSLFFGGNKNNISKCRLSIFLPNTLSALS